MKQLSKFLSTLVFSALLLTHTYAQKKVLLDAYFNNEYKTEKATGAKVPFHYRWEDTEASGFSILGKSFTNLGATLATLNDAPTQGNLKGSSVYIIVDPDTKKETATPNFIDKKSVDEIEKWVKAGGILVMFANDSTNVELPHFNELANRFGMNFNNDLVNHVTNNTTHEGGGVDTKGSEMFKTSKLVYMKDACSITLTGKAYAILKQKNDVLIAAAPYGKGMVIGIGDPWLYNEYVNGNLQKEFENDKGANDLAAWLIKNSK